MTAFTEPPGSNALLNAQREYWAAWLKSFKPTESYGSGTSEMDESNNPWAALSDLWFNFSPNALPGVSGEMSEKFLKLNKEYLNFGQTLWQAFEQAKLYDDQSDWQNNLQQMLQNTYQFSWGNRSDDPWQGLTTLWGLPADHWQKIASYFALLHPSGAEKAAAFFEGGHAKPGQHGSIFSVPPLGYTREWQEKIQQWLKLFSQYTTALQNYGLQLNKVSQRAVELLIERLIERDKEKASIESLKAFYDLWVDCGEDAYAEFVATPEFSALQAQQINTFMQLKLHEQQIIETIVSVWNLPTRAEIDTTHKRVHQLRRELRTLKQEIEELKAVNSLSAAKVMPNTAGKKASSKKTAKASSPTED